MTVDGCAGELALVPIFAKIEPSLLALLEPAAFVRRLGRGQVLFVAGEPADHVFVIRSGSLKVHVSSEHGAELVLAVLGPGQSLGEISMIDRGTRSADVTALAATELLSVPADAVRGMLDDHPAALWAVAQNLATGMRRLTQQAADLVLLDLPRRLAKLLIDSAAPVPGGASVATPAVNQSDLAAMLGVTRQSLNRALAALARRGWIDTGSHSITLHDTAAMMRFVNS